jgi:hypothetical protein
MAFGGYRAHTFKRFGSSLDAITVTAPEYGGNATFHLPYDLSLSLSSVFSVMRQGEDDEALKVYVLGLIWTPHDSAGPSITGGTP